MPEEIKKQSPESILSTHSNSEIVYGSNYYPEHIAQVIINIEPETWLDIGCNQGHLFKATKGYWKKAVGVEINPTAAKEAAKHATHVYSDDFDKIGKLINHDYPTGFDIISFNDVLEHMYNPWESINKASEYLSEDGILILQVPNISHYSIIRELLAGRFDYQSTGLLDATHIRFFTPETFREAVHRAGLEIISELQLPVTKKEDELFINSISGLCEDIETLRCFQYCIICTKKSSNLKNRSKIQQLASAGFKKIHNKDIDYDFKGYPAWLDLMKMRNAEADALLRRTQNDWKQLPVFTLFIHSSQAELPLLADTLDCLPGQHYPHWRVVVLSDAPCPDPMFDGGQLCWESDVDLTDCEAQALIENRYLHASHEGWFARLPAGTRLSDEWLICMTDYINRFPDATAFYCDHDRVNTDGHRSEPWFKPGFDPDYLYAMDYIGPAVIFSNQAVLQSGSCGNGGAWAHIDNLLRLYEQHGTTAISHIEKVLLSLPDSYRIPSDADCRARSSINQAHFLRRNIEAYNKPGFIEGTLRTEYLHPEQPLVSIIIPNRDKFEYIEPCVESLIEKTSWPNWELIIVDNQSKDPDTLDYYNSLVERLGKRFRLANYAAPFNFAAQCNLGVEMAHGDYVLLLNNDTQIVHGQWLERMMQHAQRPEVGAVGCRLVYPESGNIQHAGVAFNFEDHLNFVANHPFIGAKGEAPGYMNRILVEQSIAAVTAACLLSRKQTYQQLGGFDQKNLAVLFNDVDYCLKVGAAGYRVIYTPFATVVHHGSTSILSVNAADYQHKLESMIRAQAEHQYMLKTWLDRMAHDPANNRHLYYNDSKLRLRQHLPALWDIHFQDTPRIYGFAGEGGSGKYRIVQPLTMLEEQGQAAIMCAPHNQPLPCLMSAKRMEADIFLMQTPVSDAHFSALEAYRTHLPELRRIASLDDLLTAIPQESNVYKDWKRQFRDVRSRLRRALALCDRLIVSTETLREFCTPMIADIRVVPNRLRRSDWGHVSSLRAQGRKPRVGWVGAHQHAGDLALIREVVRALQHEVEWVFMGMWPDGLEDVAMERHAAVTYENYPQTMAALNLDIALAPLANNDFNRCKSNLRLLEYGVMGWPVVCSDIDPYRTNNAPVTRVGTDAQAWISAIRTLAQDPARAEQEGKVLRAWVDQHYWLDEHWQEWEQALLG
ncbi:methyltransferase domain-containing protein [Aquitalea sp. S1-19]|nr:methyltransferase domain-containing protein [Aquitalea sp. S1-19]